jgi:hypothetical protein
VTLSQLAGCERDTQQRGGPLGIFSERLVEVAETKEHDGAGILLLNALVLVEDGDWLQSTA